MSKNEYNWGGARDGAGRIPTYKDEVRNLKPLNLNVSEEEWPQIMESPIGNLDPRQRARFLLLMLEENPEYVLGMCGRAVQLAVDEDINPKLRRKQIEQSLDG